MAFLCVALAGIDVVAVAADHTNRSDAEKLAQVMAMYRVYQKDFPQVPDISVEKAMRMLGRSDVLFVDVREPEEQAVSIIPGAISQKQFRDARQPMLERPSLSTVPFATAAASWRKNSNTGKFTH